MSSETISLIARVVVPTDREMLREMSVAIPNPKRSAATATPMPAKLLNQETFAEGFHGNVKADLIAESKAVDDRLRDAVDADRDPFDHVFLNTFRICGSR